MGNVTLKTTSKRANKEHPKCCLFSHPTHQALFAFPLNLLGELWMLLTCWDLLAFSHHYQLSLGVIIFLKIMTHLIS